MSRAVRVLSDRQIKSFHKNGFLILDKFLPTNILDKLGSRVESLFNGNFETGIYPDEWYGREGVSLPLATKEINNAWKSDHLISSVVLSESIHEVCAQLCGWKSSRLAQDSIIVKPSNGGTSIVYHQDSPYISSNFTPIKDNSITCWLPLDDVNEEVGTLEYVTG
eukprot:UN34762